MAPAMQISMILSKLLFLIVFIFDFVGDTLKLEHSKHQDGVQGYCCPMISDSWSNFYRKH